MTENLAPPSLPDLLWHHEHTRACWWDHREARQVCPPRSPDAVPADPERPLVDTRDMVVVHTAVLREFRLAAAAVARVHRDDRRGRRRVDAHLGFVSDLLHHHHTSEDTVLWPPLRAVVPAAAAALLDAAEAQHAALDAALDEVGDRRRRWTTDGDVDARDRLVRALQTLHGLLAAHLDAEERELLPLAAAHLTQEQWDAVGAAGAASVPPSRMLLVLGLFCYEGDSAVIRSMLRTAPLPVRLLVPRIAPFVHARHARRVHGTSTP